MLYSLVDNELNDVGDDDMSPPGMKRNAVKGNLNIVNKFARHEEVRTWRRELITIQEIWSNSMNRMGVIVQEI